MSDRILKSVWTLAAVLPMLALAQPAAAQSQGTQRDDSWEWSAGVGLLYNDNALRNFLGSRGYATTPTPSRLAPAVQLRVGYNVTEHWGFSIGASGAKKSGIKYLTPFAAATYTFNLNARFSPFLSLGTGVTRITGENGRKTHPTWGTHLGVGFRSMLSPNFALRVDGRMGIEHYQDLPGAKTAYNSLLTIGFSYFGAGRRRPEGAPPCPACPQQRVRVDTVWRTSAPVQLPPLVIRDTLEIEGINFDFDSSALTMESHWALDRMAAELLKPEWANTRWEIAGHTSGIGSPEWNLGLSQRRAESVRAYLVSRGIANNRLTAFGYGETNPKYTNDSEGRNWRNRRVEMRRLKP